MKKIDVTDADSIYIDDSDKTDVPHKKSLTGRTTLSIDIDTQIKLKTMVIMGDADNKKDGVSRAIQAYYDNLSIVDQTKFDSLYKVLKYCKEGKAHNE